MLGGKLHSEYALSSYFWVWCSWPFFVDGRWNLEQGVLECLLYLSRQAKPVPLWGDHTCNLIVSAPWVIGFTSAWVIEETPTGGCHFPNRIGKKKLRCCTVGVLKKKLSCAVCCAGEKLHRRVLKRVAQARAGINSCWKSQSPERGLKIAHVWWGSTFLFPW